MNPEQYDELRVKIAVKVLDACRVSQDPNTTRSAGDYAREILKMVGIKRDKPVRAAKETKVCPLIPYKKKGKRFIRA